MACSFASVRDNPCGLNARAASETEYVVLRKCHKDIIPHLRSIGVRADSVKNEADLILSRAGKFVLSSDIHELTICPKHRAELGIGWRKTSVKCSVPQELSTHGKVHPKGKRTFGKEMSRKLFDKTNILVPIGSPFCDECRKHLESKLDDMPDGAEGIVSAMSLLHLTGQASDTGISEEVESDIVQSDDIQEEDDASLYVPPTPFLSPGAKPKKVLLDPTKQLLVQKRHALNDLLELSGNNLIESSLQNQWSEVNERHQRRCIKHVKDGVKAVIDVVAPQEESAAAIWNTVRSSDLYDSGFNNEESAKERELIEALAECYANADHWATRQQILSIMADKLQFKQLQQYIPGLTRYRYTMARTHTIVYGRGVPLPPATGVKERYDRGKLEHFLEFITSPHLIQDLPFGEKMMKLTTGECIYTPNVIRVMIPQRIIQQYNSLCQETTFSPLGDTSLKRILNACAASVRTSLQGLDYFTAEGTRAFDDLEDIVDNLVQFGMSNAWGRNQLKLLRDSKRYMKGDYKVHIADESRVADHCRQFALSDPQDPDYQTPCDHEHDEICSGCETLSITLNNIKQVCSSSELAFPSSEDREEILYRIERAVYDIQLWKGHQLRTVNQDSCKQHILSVMGDNAVMVTLDWAMKYLPRRFRESQTDWYAKRGLPWHISVAIKKCGNDYQSIAIVHIFDSTKQDSSTVIGIMEHVLKVLKSNDPSIQSAFFRQDNAGCYHSAHTILAAKCLSASTGIEVKRIDFSDPQGGKGPCDRKAAQIKRHMNIYLNEGNDIMDAKQMEKAMMSNDGIHGVQPVLTESPIVIQPHIQWSGISYINNFQFTDAGIRVWRAFNIGPGKNINDGEFQAPVVPNITVHSMTTSAMFRPTTGPSSSTINQENLDTNQHQNVCESAELTDQELRGDDLHQEVCDSTSTVGSTGIFSCPEETCTKTYIKSSALEAHILSGKHDRYEQRERLLDRAKIRYAEMLSREENTLPQVVGHTGGLQCIFTESTTELCRGWALKSGRKHTRFSKKQKDFLIKRFEHGEITGNKDDPSRVAKQMRCLKDENNERVFSATEYLTPQQIGSFFSRLSAKKRANGDLEEITDELEDPADTVVFQDSLRHVVLDVSHPIIVGEINVCRSVKNYKLQSLSIDTLKDICSSLNIDTSDVNIRRKAPYMDKIRIAVRDCTCSH